MSQSPYLSPKFTSSKFARFKLALPAFALLLMTPACNTVSQNGAILNQKINDGISQNQVEIEKIITALADVERQTVEEEWENIYDQVEKQYISENKLNLAKAELTQKHRRNIATISARTYYDLLEKIALTEKKLIAVTRLNSKTVQDANNEVTKYLLKVKTLQDVEGDIQKNFNDINGLDLSSLSGLAKKLIGTVQE